MREFYDLKENDNKDLIIKFERDTVERCQKDLWVLYQMCYGKRIAILLETRFVLVIL
jgi:hypothetical protein